MTDALEALLRHHDPAVRAQGWELYRSLPSPAPLDLRHASLYGDDLSGLTLGPVELAGADLSLVDLRGADLRAVQLRVPLWPVLSRHLRFTLGPYAPGLLTLAASYVLLCVLTMGGAGLALAAWSGPLAALIVFGLASAPLLAAWPLMSAAARHRQLSRARWDETTRLPPNVSAELLRAAAAWPDRRPSWGDIALVGLYFVSCISRKPENASE